MRPRARKTPRGTKGTSRTVTRPLWRREMQRKIRRTGWEGGAVGRKNRDGQLIPSKAAGQDQGEKDGSRPRLLTRSGNRAPEGGKRSRCVQQDAVIGIRREDGACTFHFILVETLGSLKGITNLDYAKGVKWKRQRKERKKSKKNSGNDLVQKIQLVFFEGRKRRSVLEKET